MKRVSPYLKIQVLSAIDYAEGKTRAERIKKVAGMKFKDEDENLRQFTWRTISTWYCRYKKHGITSMKTKKRSDTGKPRCITPEQLLEAINQAIPHFHEDDFDRMQLYRKIIELGLISRKQLGQTTFYRYVKKYDLLSKDNNSLSKRRLAFAMQYANELWQGDTMYGPYVKNEQGKSIQTRLIAFIDDASRVITHGEFFFNENKDSLITTLRKAFYKRGIPQQMYVDHGGIYTSKELILLCARIGCILRHAPVRDGAAKGKIERFFRRVRQQFLCRNLNLSSLAALNKEFSLWLEDEYNSKPHSSLGMKPVDRYTIDLDRIKFLPPGQVSDELFYVEETRKVKKDNTFPFKNIRYEAPADLRDKTITVRFDRYNPSVIAVYYKDTRMGEASPLDLIANGRLKQRREAK